MTDIAADRRSTPDRRARSVSFHYPERRTGFARRRPPAGRVGAAYLSMLETYRTSPGAIASVVAAIVALNVADLLLTMRALGLGATEANPIMAALFGLDPLVAAAFKLSIAGGVAVALWGLRRFRLILECSLALLLAFTGLLAYHLIGATL